MLVKVRAWLVFWSRPSDDQRRTRRSSGNRRCPGHPRPAHGLSTLQSHKEFSVNFT